ncbi:MAG: cobalamin biosynthesis protein, partial [Sciscionella sp.]
MIGLFAVSAAGQRAAAVLAEALGEDTVLADAPLRDSLTKLWPRLRAAVFFLATGATVRLIAPLLADKHTDPAVVCVDEAGHFAVALAGGHAGGANALAGRVAELLGAIPVVTTASDATGGTALDELADLLEATVDGDIAGCGIAVLDGAPVRIVNPLGYPLPALPPNVGEHVKNPEWTIVIDDRPCGATGRRVLRLTPRTLVVGIGSATQVSTEAVRDTLCRMPGVDQRAIRAFATIDIKAEEPGILCAVADWAARTRNETPAPLVYPAAILAAIEVPNPSEVVRVEVGTASVAEAAALHGAAELARGAPVELVVPKLKGDNVT